MLPYLALSISGFMHPTASENRRPALEVYFPLSHRATMNLDRYEDCLTLIAVFTPLQVINASKAIFAIALASRISTSELGLGDAPNGQPARIPHIFTSKFRAWTAKPRVH